MRSTHHERPEPSGDGPATWVGSPKVPSRPGGDVAGPPATKLPHSCCVAVNRARRQQEESRGAAPTPVSAAWHPGDPPGRRQFVHLPADRPFALDGGGPAPRRHHRLRDLGRSSTPRPPTPSWCATPGPATATSPARSAPATRRRVGGRAWSGPGCPIDTDRYFVVCANVLGGCQGTTGPASIDPATGRPYGPPFPVVTIRDMVRAQAALADHLGVRAWLSVIGGSMGGMQALEWGITYPDRVRSIIPIATCAQATAQQIAWSAVGRRAVRLDPGLRGGDYYDAEPGDGPDEGLAVARMLAQITFRSDDVFTDRFGRELADGDGDRSGCGSASRSSATSTTTATSSSAASTPTATSSSARRWTSTTSAAGRGGLEAAMARIKAPTLVVGIWSDMLYPSYQQQQIRQLLDGRRPPGRVRGDRLAPRPRRVPHRPRPGGGGRVGLPRRRGEGPMSNDDLHPESVAVRAGPGRQRHRAGADRVGIVGVRHAVVGRGPSDVDGGPRRAVLQPLLQPDGEGLRGRRRRLRGGRSGTGLRVGHGGAGLGRVRAVLARRPHRRPAPHLLGHPAVPARGVRRASASTSPSSTPRSPEPSPTRCGPGGRCWSSPRRPPTRSWRSPTSTSWAPSAVRSRWSTRRSPRRSSSSRCRSGVDLVLHSATKGIAGHNDATLGVVAGARRAARRHLELRRSCTAPAPRPTTPRTGCGASAPWPCASSARARPRCAWPRSWSGTRPWPPCATRGLASHPQHDLAKRQMAFGGSMLAFDLAGGLDAGAPVRRGGAAGPDGVVARRARDARHQPGQLDPRRARRRRAGSRPASDRDWCGCRSGSSTRTICWPTSSRHSATERQGVSASSVVAAFDLAGTRHRDQLVVAVEQEDGEAGLAAGRAGEHGPGGLGAMTGSQEAAADQHDPAVVDGRLGVHPPAPATTVRGQLLDAAREGAAVLRRPVRLDP